MYLYSDSHNCFDCQSKDNQIQDARYWLRAILDQLFGLGDFNKDLLFNSLEEMAHLLDVSLPDRDLSVVRKERTVDFSKLLEEWKKANNDYLKNLHTGS
jgi:hypothetical protein